MSRIAMMGSGAWGTALAISLARRGGHEIALWSYAKDVAETMRERRENTAFLPGFQIPESVAVFEDAAEALDSAEIVVSVTPSQFVRSTYVGLRAASARRSAASERNQRHRGRNLSADDRSDWRSAGGARDGAALRRAERAVVRPGSGGWRAHCDRHRFGRCEAGRASTARVLQRHTAPLHQRRCRRCGTGRIAEERDCHRGGYRRGPRTGIQQQRCADHAWPRGNHAPCGCVWRPTRDPGRALREWAIWC